MRADWTEFLGARGAVLEDGIVRDFGDPTGERLAARAADVLADLSHLGLVDVSGADAQAFLQAQLSCDVNGLGRTQASLGAYCSPKGRMLASFLVWPEADGYSFALARSLVEPTIKRLRMFVLRAKVVLGDRSDERILLGASGPSAEGALRASVGLVPEAHHRVAHGADSTIVRVAPNRFLVATSPERAQSLWGELAPVLRPVGTPCWEWLDIREGIPLVTARTQDELVPQMANLEILGGVSFQKGCYPGQEVVARTQYRGKSARRMFLARVEGAEPAAGDPLFSEALGDQASGIVVNVAPAPEGGHDVLVVVHAQGAAPGTVHLGATTGPPLRFRALPYAVP